LNALPSLTEKPRSADTIMDQVEVLLGQSTRQPLVNLLGLHPFICG
jgi:hypothetical protein